MSLNESIVEDAALAMPMAALIPAFSQREKEEGGYVVQSRFAQTLTRPLQRGEEKREAIRRPAGAGPAIPVAASACADHPDRRAAIKRCLRTRFVRRLNP